MINAAAHNDKNRNKYESVKYCNFKNSKAPWKMQDKNNSVNYTY